MGFLAGDEFKESLHSRGLTFERVLEAVASGELLDFIPNPVSAYPDQMLLIVKINGYVHAAPCEPKGHDWRIITAFPSRKYHKRYGQNENQE
jgi:hypothetical protein